MANKLVIYTVQDADGNEYDIEGPEGATAEQLQGVISPQAAPAAAPSAVSAEDAPTPRPGVPTRIPKPVNIPMAEPAIPDNAPTMARNPLSPPSDEGAKTEETSAINPLREEAATAANTFTRMMRDSKYTEDDIRAYTKSLPSGMTIANADYWLEQRRKGGGIPDTVVSKDIVDPLNQDRLATPEDAKSDRTILERFSDGFDSAVQHGFAGVFGRTWHDWANTGKDDIKKMFPGHDDKWYEQMQRFAVVNAQKTLRESQYAREAADPANSASDYVGTFGGNIVGSIGPEAAIVPGASMITRAVGQAAIAGASDIGYQGADVAAGVADEYNGDQTLLSAATGGVAQLGLEGLARGVGKGVRAIRGEVPEVAAPPVQAPEAPPAPIANPGSRARVAAKEEYRSAIEARVAEVAKDWSNAPQFEVVHSIKDIADPAVRAATQKEGGAGALGFVGPDGVVRIITKNIKHEADVPALVFHEALGHHGLSQRFGDELDNLLNDFDNTEPAFARQIDEWIDKHPDSYRGDTQRIRAAEEILAEMSQNGKLDAKFVDRITNKVKEFARAAGINLNYSMREIRTILAMSHDAVVNGRGTDVIGNGFRFKGNNDNEARTPAEQAQYAEDRILASEGVPDQPKYLPPQEFKDTHPEDLNRPRYKAQGWESGNGMNEREAAKATKQMWIRKQREEGSYPEIGRADTARLDMPEGDIPHSDRIKIASKLLSETPKGKTAFIQPFDNLPDYHRFRHTNMDGEAVTGSYHVNPETGNIDGFSIGMDGKPNRIGPSEVKKIARAIRQEHPDAVEIEGFRVSGGRKASGKGQENVVANLNRFMQQDQLELTDRAGIQAPRQSLEELSEGYTPSPRSWNEAKRAARDAGLTPKQIRAAKGVGELDKKLFQYDTAVTKLGDNLGRLGAKLEDGTFTVADKAKFLQDSLAFVEVGGRIFDDQAEIGRALNAMKILAYTKNKVANLNEILREHGGNTISGFADDEVFNRYAQQVMAMLNSGNHAGAAAMTKSIVKPYWWQYILSFRHAAMLSGLGTHAKNVTDNGLMIARELEEAVLAMPGSLVRKGINSVGGNVKPGVSPTEIAGRAYGLIRAALDSTTYKDTYKAFIEGHGNSQISTKVEMQDARIPVLSAVTDALHAQDIFFRSFMNNANLYGLGIRQASEEGLRGGAAFQAGSNYAINPSKELLEAAKKASDVSLLVDTPFFNRVETWKSIRPGMSAEDQLKVFVANLALPFFRVTDRLLFQKLRRSPLSFVDRVTREDFAAGGARRDIAIARTLYGSALIYYYWNMAGDEEGQVNGEGGNYKKEEALAAGGHLPNAVNDGDQYTDASALNLSGNPLDLHNLTAANVAGLRKAWEKGEDVSESLKLTFASFMGQLSSASFAENLSQYIEPFKAGQTEGKLDAGYGTFAANLAGSFIPTAIRQGNTVFGDTTKRVTKGDGSIGDRIMGRVIASVPGLSTTLPAKIDTLGRPLEQGKTLSAMSNYQRIDKDPTVRELARLEKSTDQIVVGVPKDTFQRDGVSIEMTPDQFEIYQRQSGELFLKAMKKITVLPKWRKASDATKIEAVKEVLEMARTDTKEQLFPSPSEGDEEE